MGKRRVAVELTEDELDVLLRWCETATRPLYPSRDRYLGVAEAELLAKLEAQKRNLYSDEPTE